MAIEIGFKKERLRQLRDDVDMTQKDFSTEIGCTMASLSAYENGSKIPPTSTLTNIAKRFHCSVDWLLGIKDEMTYDLGDQPADNYSDYIKRLFSLYGSDIELDIGSDCSPTKDTTNISKGISFKDPIIKAILINWGKIVDLYEEGTIDETLYTAWTEKVINDFNHGRILEDGLDYTWFEQNYSKHFNFQSEYEYDATLRALQDTFQQVTDKKSLKTQELANDPGEL